MRSRARVIGVASVALVLLVLSFFYLSATDLPDYLPEKAHDYFHHEQPAPPNSVPLPPNTGGTDTITAEGSELYRILEDFLESPVLSYDDSVKLGSKTCPTKGVNYDRNGVDNSGTIQKWRAIPSSQISEWRQGIVEHLRGKDEEERKSKAGKRETKAGRGIVMAAGDHNAVVRVQTSVKFLKSYNCTLPLEIFHFASELSTSDQKFLKELSQLEEGQDGSSSGLKVTLKLVENVEKGNGWKDFHIKAAAIQQSSFDEILYLDTDSYLLRDPNYLFEGNQWKEKGLLLWPDFTKSHAANPLWRLLGQPCRNEYEGESGQILISRTRHQDVLWLVEYFAIHHDDYYDFMGGDRDSFRAAALLLGKAWGGPGRILAAAGVAKSVKGSFAGGHTMLQADPDGNWMFVHANLIKHGTFQRPLWARIHRATRDKYEVGTTYGNTEPPNDMIGEGVRSEVLFGNRMEVSLTSYSGYDAELVTDEDWDMYDELKGFEDKWFGFGGAHP